MSETMTMVPVHREGLASHAYHDRESGMDAVKLLPNEYFVTQRNMLLATVLGSCVAACVRDPFVGIGGMNHFMLPAAGAADGPQTPSMRYGAYAMSVLLEALFACGARRERLEAKVFGGGMVLTDMAGARVGEANAEFALDYLHSRDIRIVAQDLKDVCPRYVQYFPASGRVRVKRLKCTDTLMQREAALAHASAATNAPAEAGGSPGSQQ